VSIAVEKQADRRIEDDNGRSWRKRGRRRGRTRTGMKKK